jgi:hypothetical protein
MLIDPAKYLALALFRDNDLHYYHLAGKVIEEIKT